MNKRDSQDFFRSEKTALSAKKADEKNREEFAPTCEPAG